MVQPSCPDGSHESGAVGTRRDGSSQIQNATPAGHRRSAAPTARNTRPTRRCPSRASAQRWRGRRPQHPRRCGRPVRGGGRLAGRCAAPHRSGDHPAAAPQQQQAVHRHSALHSAGEEGIRLSGSSAQDPEAFRRPLAAFAKPAGGRGVEVSRHLETAGRLGTGLSCHQQQCSRHDRSRPSLSRAKSFLASPHHPAPPSVEAD
ncbi:hypothetical protein C8J45_11355 [Sphingomonas sp. PP-CE-3G-477]|nr:hypothetical protein C8J45_11355 [Sphingomonas sp. PP-CE-3G-477]